MQDLMTAKYNSFLDNALLRIAATAVFFAVWLGASYSLLRVAL